MNIICWNSRSGLSNPEKQRLLRGFCCRYRLTFLGLAETKRGDFDDFLLQNICVGSPFHFHFAPQMEDQEDST